MNLFRRNWKITTPKIEISFDIISSIPSFSINIQSMPVLKISPINPTDKKMAKRLKVWSFTLKLYFLFREKLVTIPMTTLKQFAKT